MTKKPLTTTERQELLVILKERFEKNISRHQRVEWNDLEKNIAHDDQLLWSLHAMEKTGGEPDVVVFSDHEVAFVDCSPESPADRRSPCYDQAAWESRKAHKPVGNAVDTAQTMGISLLTEEEYHHVQTLGDFDLKTSSWLHTPEDVRSRGGSLFGDRRYGRTFIYHNGAESYYAARGFRGKVSISL